jgi:hypothetical protein
VADVPLPTFLIIGAAKAGTTALHTWLADHPQVCMSRPKETQYFSADHAAGGYERAWAHWAGQPAIGESTPMYLALPYVPERIARTVPDAQLLAVLRDPADQAFSAWWMMRCLGGEPRSFEEAIDDALAQGPLSDAEAERRWQAVVHPAAGTTPGTFYLLMGSYRDAIQRYHRQVGADRLHVFLYEDLVRSPLAVTQAVCDIIGVDHALAPTPVPEGRNQAVGRAEAWARRHLLTRPVPSKARKAAFRSARLLDRSGPPRLEPEMRATLVTYFAEVNSGLGELIGRDVGAWDVA